MVYINLKQDAPVLFVPLNGWKVADPSQLELRIVSTADGSEAVAAISEAFPWGWLVRLTLEGNPVGIHAGEWRYTLALGDRDLATGLLTATDGEPRDTQYNTQSKVKQYGE